MKTKIPNTPVEKTMQLCLGEIHTYVSDLSSARFFYADVLNLELITEAKNFLAFDLGDTKFIIFSGAKPQPENARYGSFCNTVLCLRTSEIEEDYEKLLEKGVTFASELQDVQGIGKYVAFQDPDGNWLELIEKRQR